jgi:M6 family metalloprotease-like protein
MKGMIMKLHKERSYVMRKLYKSISTLLIVFIILLIFPIASQAVPAAPGTYILKQPDKSSFVAKQWGDEFQHGWETEEGYTIEFDRRLNAWTYMTVDANYKPVPSSKIVGKDNPGLNEPKHIRPSGYGLSAHFVNENLKISSAGAQQQAVAVTGNNYIPVILINFSNTTTKYSSADFNNLLFGSGNYSMKDYYQEVSYGLFSISAGPEGIAGWYTASNPHNYYGQNGGSFGDMWPGDLVYEAVAAADAAGFNFAPYDQDGDCYIDVVSIIHQGSGEEAGGSLTDIWSHSWGLNSALAWGESHYGEYITNDDCTWNPLEKVKVDGYVIQPEILWGGMQTMGVFAHEYGHTLGLPDLYDTDYSSQGVGKWSLMAVGMWNYATTPGDRPAYMDAWSKYFLGWVSPTQVSRTLMNESITQASSAADVYQLLNGSPLSGEYFLVENRQKTGFDAALPGSGLLIWHIDGNMISSKLYTNQVNNTECYPSSNCNSNHYGVALVQADTLWELEKGLDSGDSGDPYRGITGKTLFTSASSPNSKLYNNSYSNVSISNISTSGPTITATISVLSIDLIISSLTVPATGTPGSTMNISYTNKNNGPDAAPASTTKFYWSTNTMIDSGDTYLGSRSIPALASGASSAGSITVTVPSSACSGTFYILAKADATNLTKETSENNNTKYKTINTGPDLIVSTVSSPATGGAGQNMVVTDTTKNSGVCKAGASTTKYYFSSDSIWDEGDTLIGNRSVTSLAKGTLSSGSTLVTIPMGIAAGTYYLITKADANNTVVELSETNNNITKSVVIGPDLTMSFMSAPISAGRGRTINISDTIKNIGGGSSIPSTIKFYLSTNTGYDAGDTLVGSRVIPSLSASTSSSGSTSVILPIGIPTGVYYIIARSDADKVVAETNETNNNKSLAITINP